MLHHGRRRARATTWMLQDAPHSGSAPAHVLRRHASHAAACITPRTGAPRQVDAFMFGSVPLKTYLPDGDIDLSIFCGPDVAAALKDAWALKLQNVLLAEQANADAPFVVGDVTVINAEVRG